MLARSRANGIANFHVFGEVATSGVEVELLARYTKDGRFPAVLDFAFAHAVRAAVAGSDAGTDVLAQLFAQDRLYGGAEQTALQLPTFISNHDMGRFAWFVRADRPQASDEEVLKRVTLAHAMLLTLRGVPVVYYGDEQGFAGTGGDQDARQDMFATQTPLYRTDRRIGVSQTSAADPQDIAHEAARVPATTNASPTRAARTIADASPARDAYDPTHPLFRTVAQLSTLRKNHAALRRGRQVVRSASSAPGVFAVSRFDPVTGHEILFAFNTSMAPLTATVDVAPAATHFESLHGTCALTPTTPGKYAITLPALGFIVCRSQDAS
jgi:glycosidase